MKKIGFTLSELVIAMSIIGISAALVAPIVSRFMPDVKKTNVLKYHVLINNAIVDYYNSPCYNLELPDCRGLACFDSAVNGCNDNDFSEFLERELNVEAGLAPDGIGVEIVPEGRGFQVTLDTEPGRDGGSFTLDNTNPDAFIFNINDDGYISAGDALTEAYLNNQYSMNDKEADIQRALNNPRF